MRLSDTTPARPAMVLAIALTVALAGCAAAPRHFMQKDNELTPCPGGPHCVSSQAAPDDSHHVAPLSFDSSADTAHNALVTALQSMSGATIKRDDPRFIHAVFKTTLGFADDVTFIVQPDQNIIDVKSESRIGYYDFGKNGRRVADIRKRFARQLASAASK